jgi:hypothetical protein
MNTFRGNWGGIVDFKRWGEKNPLYCSLGCGRKRMEHAVLQEETQQFPASEACGFALDDFQFQQQA